MVWMMGQLRRNFFEKQERDVQSKNIVVKVRES